MDLSSQFRVHGIGGLEVLSEDNSGLVFCRGWRDSAEGRRNGVLVLHPASEQPTPAAVDRLTHEYSLKDELVSAWAVRPLELVRDRGQTILVLEDPGGELLSGLLGMPMDVERFLRLAVGAVAAVGKLHQRDLIHKDIKPVNILVNIASGEVRLTGFGITSRLPRERQPPDPPEFIAGTLAYMAPEQTGRMNRSVDSRSDLYSLGVTLYEMLTGSLPFTASDPMEWVHCHIARQAHAPSERAIGIPEVLSSIVMKLLAKTAEERYQTVAGVEADLRRCLSEWQSHGRIDSFPIGEHDKSDRPLIPEKLYGRASEINTLLAAFDRVVGGGRPELILVSGYSGVGKSSVVNELHKPLVPPRGLFASGKFDQYKRDIPYATLAQAFQSLIRPILTKNEEELGRWRDAICEALGPNGRIVLDLVPELKFIIGEQQPVPELPSQDAKSRFQLVFRRFISAFTRKHPTALFLDDLQWLDAATLDLMEDLLTHPDVKDLLLIGAYRDNEVAPAHPLMRKLQAMRKAGAIVHDIVLTPLTRHDLEQLIADSLHCEPGRAGPLAGLVEEKTTGNPFFAIQFISALFEEGLLTFDHIEGKWCWDLSHIHAKGYTDNVVDLLVGKLNRLPTETQRALQQLACLGNNADFAMLRTVYQDSSEAMHGQLWEAVRTGLMFRSEYSYRFLHDRVQEAAYSLIPQELRAGAHLRIGMLMASHTPPDKLEETIFEIANQLNRGSHLITPIAERERIAELNLIAGRRAKISTAYASALKYLHAGHGLLTDETWNRNYDLVFSIEALIAECELHTVEMVAAEGRLTTLAQRARSRHDFAVVARLQITLYTTLDRSDRAIEVFLDYLRRNGTDWSPHPTRNDVIQEYNRIWSLVGNRQIEDLVELPLLNDPDVLDMLDVFTEIVHPAMFFDENLSTLVVFRMVSLCLEHGNCDASCFGYVWFGMFAGPRFNNYADGFRFGQLGYDLVEKLNLTRYAARTYTSFGTLTPWAKHAAKGRELIRRAFDVAYRTGDLTFSAYSSHSLIANYLAVGDPLSEAQSEVEKGLNFVKKAGFGLVIENCWANLGLIRTLRGLTSTFGCFDAHDYNESDTERRFASNPALALAEFFYWTRKLQARFLAGDYASAVEASENAYKLLWPAASQVETGDFRFYAALAHAAAWNAASAEERQKHFVALKDHHRQLDIWALHCPANFETKTRLVSAEIARIEGRIPDAEHFYEAAIRSAQDNSFVHCEAVANECAAQFYLERGLRKIAYVYLRDARDCYLRWGADGKVRQLEARFPQLAAQEEKRPGSIIGSPVQQLDVASVVKASQAVSSEIELPKLIERLMTIALENAGADRGLLILPAGDEYLIRAGARTCGDQVEVTMRRESINRITCPESLVRYVIRTLESVILDDASKPNLFSGDDYLRDQKSKSVLCLPLIKQGKLTGVLFLENALTSHAFSPARIAVLELLAGQAAISVENTRLYSELQERETKVRRLVDSNIIGILFGNPDGHVQEANQAFLQIVGYDQADVAAGRLRRTELTPAEWHDRDARAVIEMRTTGAVQPFEKEYFRKDGSRVPVLVGGAALDERGDTVVIFAVDLTERKRAEVAARENELRFRDVQMELAHANRVATMGQLTASIAHEVNQPIAAALTNAETAVRWLNREPPNLEKAKQLIERTINDGKRAADIVGRIREFSKKAPPQRADLEINEAILEIMGLTRVPMSKNGVVAKMQLAKRLPHFLGDRIQLQQVILNLIMNAIEAMSEIEEGSRELLISTSEAESNGVLIAVSDTGPGLPQAGPERIFDAFYTTKPDGLGMGLSICRSIVEAHGGRLWATPNEPRGAVFYLKLPIGEP